MIDRKILLAGWLAALLPTAPHAQTVVPSRFEADRVYVQLQTEKGEPLELYTDTGGGGLVLSRAAAARLGIGVPEGNMPERPAGAQDAPRVPAPRLAPSLPPLPEQAIVMPRAAQIPRWPEQGDGFLGARWFAQGIWTWDYPNKQLVKERADWQPAPGARLVPLRFKTDPDGSRPTGFARVAVTIAQQELPMLLDTGAETYLTQEALAALGGGERMRATSMISASLFDRWHREHPEWRFIPAAQETTRSDMIEVPDVRIAGLQVGPVWFTHRSDASFHEFMSSMMDARVEGALGGNALRTLRMTIDYPGARAAFCRSPCGG
jgi:hypothetical protein